MTRIVRLRPWQKAAFDRFAASDATDFLAVATPGAGKTTFALTAARWALSRHPTRLVVVAPTAHLKLQWARAAAAFSLQLDPDWSGRGLARDVHGIVTTYQQVASSPEAVAALAADAFVVLDEVHHAADERAWGAAVQLAFADAAQRLSLSGTPFRSDTRAIPFVHYDGDEAAPDYEYSYGDALADRAVVRPVYFPRTNGHMEWAAPDGSLHSATFDDPLAATRASERLRTALSLEGEWLPSVLQSAVERLGSIRRDQPDAGGLVIAIDQEHARGIAGMLEHRFRTRARVVISDDPAASAGIEEFAAGREPWLVAVRMVSEGVDIPRLRVGVYATTTTTELFFRQAVGRLVRWTRGTPRQRAWLFIPDDPRLRVLAARIAEQRRHSLRRAAQDALEASPFAAPVARLAEQMSLFAPLSAVATDAVDAEDDLAWVVDADVEEDGAIELALAPPPPLLGGDVSAGGLRHEEKRWLRDANATLARDLAKRTSLSHAKVNAELNERAGIRRVSTATAPELQRRLRAAERWLATA
jgi:superfamily II DNA or RNA helicase